MKTSLRMIFVLGLIAAVAGGALAGVNAWTAPLIEENTAIRLQNTLASVLDADEFELQEDTEYTLWHGYRDGDLMGYVVRLRAAGYSPTGIDMLVGVDTDGNVQGVFIFGHSETPGLGDKIENTWFLEQFVGLGLGDDIARGVDVDGITGATVSANAVMTAVRNSVQFVGQYADLIDEPGIINLADIPDGTYTGSGRGFIDTIVVEVTIEDGKLVSVVIIEEDETASYAGPAFDTIPQAMVDEQRIDVDVVSGATGTSQGIIAAVRDALAEFATGDIEISELPGGIYRGEALGFDGSIFVEAEITDGQLMVVTVLEHNDTPSYAEPAFETMIERLLAAQSLDVDTVSGATFSSQGLLDALKDAFRGETIIEISRLEDGNYFGEAQSFGGLLTVKAVVANGQLESVEVLDHSDTPDYANPAFEEIIENLLDAQSLDVDVVSGATFSSRGLLDALAAALGSAPRLDLSQVPDGTFTGRGDSFGGELEIEVTVADGQITDVTVLSHSDTPDYANPAFEELAETVIDQQDIYVDAVSGATFSSRGWLQALEDALRRAVTD